MDPVKARHAAWTLETVGHSDILNQARHRLFHGDPVSACFGKFSWIIFWIGFTHYPAEMMKQFWYCRYAFWYHWVPAYGRIHCLRVTCVNIWVRGWALIPQAPASWSGHISATPRQHAKFGVKYVDDSPRMGQLKVANLVRWRAGDLVTMAM